MEQIQVEKSQRTPFPGAGGEDGYWLGNRSGSVQL